MIIRICFIYLLLHLTSYQKNIPDTEKADVILTNATFITLDSLNATAESLAIKDGKIIWIGNEKDAATLKDDNTKVIDLKGGYAYPGLIEGHGHFSSLGESLQNLYFLEDTNWDATILKVSAKAKQTKNNDWIIGRGWHQEKWKNNTEPFVKGWPTNEKLNAVTKNVPVILHHASGHAIMANKKAMELADIDNETVNPDGGIIVRNEDGIATGIFEETAESLIIKAYKKFLSTKTETERLSDWYEAIELVQNHCLKNGITSFQDAGASYAELKRYQKMAGDGKLKVRLWAMISDSQEDFEEGVSDYPVIGMGSNFFTCRAVKSYMDGALGSFGAWLLKAYNDKPNFYGQNITSLEKIQAISNIAVTNNLQHCIHAIGDKANREVLNIFENTFKANANKTDFRWRIEHAQHIDLADIPRFAELGVIASMQAIHCTSDAPFVEKRLGKERAENSAYPWRTLLDNDVLISNGTDTPVEAISPIANFYASVSRQSKYMEEPFYPAQKMTRKEALQSLTINNAFAAFEENIKGSLEVGKLADITVLDKNLLTCEEAEILTTKVLWTIVDGQILMDK